MARSSEFSNFERYENQLQQPYDEIKLPFTPQEVVTVHLLTYKRIQNRFFDFAQKPSSVHFIVSCPKISNRQLRSFVTHDVGAIASGLAKLMTSDNLINQTFKFVVPKQQNHSSQKFPVNFEVNLNYRLFPSHISGKETVDASTLPNDGSIVSQTIIFKHAKIELHIEIRKSIRTTPDFRYSLGLSPDERAFRKKRIPIVCETMKAIFGEDKGPRSPEETPIVSLVGSGGGFRAIEGMCGAMEALKDTGLMDILTYISGISGSAWYLTSAYALKSFKASEQEDLHEGLKYRLQDNSISAVFRPRNAHCYEKYLKKSCKKHGQPHTFANYFPGFIIGKQLLKKKVSERFSSTIPYVEDGSVPYPILVALQVKSRVKSAEYNTIMERTPHEMSFPSYGINIQSKDDACTWCHGFCAWKCPEFPLHFVIAMTGCAFAILLNSYYETGCELERKFLDYVEEQRLKGRTKAEGRDSDDEANCDYVIASDDESLNEPEEPVIEEFNSTDNISVDDLDYELIELPDGKTPKFNRLNRATIKQIEKENPEFLSRNAIVGRTFRMKNFALGMDGIKRFPLNPLVTTNPCSDDCERQTPGSFGVEEVKYKLSTTKNIFSIADAGVLNNVSLNVVLRPQRATDLLIVMDFNAYDSDESFDYQPLITAAKQAYQAGIEVPDFKIEDLANLPPKELLILPSHGPNCPTILWFTLCNKKFKGLKDYVPRSTEKKPNGDTRAFNDFKVYGKASAFDTLKFYRSKYNFDQLRELMYYNVSSHAEEIKSALLDAILQKREKLQKQQINETKAFE